MKKSNDQISSEDMPAITPEDLGVNVNISSKKMPRNEQIIDVEKKVEKKAAKPPKSQKPLGGEDPFGSVKRLQRINNFFRFLFISLVILTAASLHYVIFKKSIRLENQIRRLNNNVDKYEAKVSTVNTLPLLQEIEKKVAQNGEVIFSLNTTVNQKNIEAFDKVKTLEKVNKQLLSEKAILAASVQALQQKAQVADNTPYKKEIAGLKKSLDILKKDKADVVNDRNSLNLKNKALEAQLRSMKSDRQNLSKLSSRQLKDYERMKANYKKLEQINNEYLKDLIEYKRVIKAYQKTMQKHGIRHPGGDKAVKPKPEVKKTQKTAVKKKTDKVLKLYEKDRKKDRRKALEKHSPQGQTAKPAKVKPKKTKKVKPVEEEKDNNFFWVW